MGLAAVLLAKISWSCGKKDLSIDRAMAMNWVDVNKYFDLLFKILQDNNYNQEFDIETG